MNDSEITTRKRLCIDARFYRRSTAGIGRYTRALIRNLIALNPDFDITVILTPADYKEWPNDPLPENWHVEVLDCPHYSVKEQTVLLDYLNKQKFDLVHFTQFNHPIRYKGAAIFTIYDLTMHYYPPKPLWHPKTWAYRYTMRRAATWGKHIITDSDNTKKDLVDYFGINPNKCTTTLLAVEPEFVPQKLTDKGKALREKYGLTKPFFLFINSWRPHKGLPDLIKAFLQLKEKYDVQLLVAGKPIPTYPDIITTVNTAKNQTSDIIAPGFIPDEDIIDLYSLAEAYINPSHYEGFGLGVLEAMACGCPVISAKNSSIPEVLGDTGLYYTTGDSNDLAKTLAHFIDTPSLKEELSKKGLIKSKQFSFEKMARETLEVYKKYL